MIELRRYTAEMHDTWNSFVAECKNATFLHNRDYMDYHSDRFTDYSLMAYSDNKLIALLPANRVGDTLFSHQGLTYGGLLIRTKHFNVTNMLEIFDEMSRVLPADGIKELIYKAVPHIYHSYPAEEDLYAIFRYGGTLIETNVSTTIPLENAISYNYTYRKAVRIALQNNVQITESESLDKFWKILSDVLENKYNTSPVHSIEEITLLKERFPKNIRLFLATMNDTVIAGTLIYDTGIVAHAQYIATNEDGKNIKALPLLYKHLTETVFKDRKYFDFGISNEDHGRYLNEGLVMQKNHLGGRAIVHNIYKLTF